MEDEDSIHVPATLDSEKARRFNRIKRLLATPRAEFAIFRVKTLSL